MYILLYIALTYIRISAKNGRGTSRSAKSSADPVPGISPKKATSKNGPLVVMVGIDPIKKWTIYGVGLIKDPNDRGLYPQLILDLV